MTWADRIVQQLPSRAQVWLHAASVGEVRMLEPLVRTLSADGTSIFLTVMTTTGAEQARRQFDDISAVSIALFPLDLPPVIDRWMSDLSPRLLVIAETEIWPNLIAAARQKSVPVVLVNGRLSLKAERRYRWLSGSFRSLLTSYHRLFVKTAEDGARFAGLGAPAERICVIGDLKTEAVSIRLTTARRESLRAAAGISSDQFLFVAGSTRPGEESLLLDWYCDLRRHLPAIRLLLAPRHLERLAEVFGELNSRSLSATLVSLEGVQAMPDAANCSDDTVLVISEMGILREWYGAADLAFVGGTVAAIGGHNLLEPVQAGTPVVFGSSVFNVQEAARTILQNNWGAQIESISELTPIMMRLASGEQLFASYQPPAESLSATETIANHLRGLINRD